MGIMCKFVLQITKKPLTKLNTKNIKILKKFNIDLKGIHGNENVFCNQIYQVNEETNQCIINLPWCSTRKCSIASFVYSLFRTYLSRGILRRS